MKMVRAQLVKRLLGVVDPWKTKPRCASCHERVPLPHLWWIRDPNGIRPGDWCSACLALNYLNEYAQRHLPA